LKIDAEVQKPLDNQLHREYTDYQKSRVIRKVKPLMKKENLILFLLLPVVTAVCVLIWYSGTSSFYDRVDYRYIPSDNGNYDLSTLDFENTVIRINGNVEFIPNALLTPEAFAAHAAEAAAMLHRFVDKVK
jgi:hypothetical protein